MSVLIKGMKMPKCCRDCPLFMNVWFGEMGCRAIDHSLYFDDGEVFKPWKQRYKGCPLVEVPDKHGRLIDVYAINMPYDICDGNEAMEVIKETPTVIEAEEEFNG